MSNTIPEAIHVFDKYYACPCCSGGKNVKDEAAVYHSYSFTHDPFECKDCRNMFSMPEGVKLNKPFKFKKKVKKPITKEPNNG